MDLLNAIRTRHSVRTYTDRPIEGDTKTALLDCIDQCNRDGRLNMRLVLNDPTTFDSRLAHYGHFAGVRNHIAMSGKKRPDLDEALGYYGEKVVLTAQALGLNTCWAALTYNKRNARRRINDGETLRLVIAIGYGTTNGIPHKSKPRRKVMTAPPNPPAWFLRGIDSALLAPTAVNQQQFHFSLDGDIVHATTRPGFYNKIDLGIAKLHFELGAGKDNFSWK